MPFSDKDLMPFCISTNEKTTFCIPLFFWEMKKTFVFQNFFLQRLKKMSRLFGSLPHFEDILQSIKSWRYFDRERPSFFLWNQKVLAYQLTYWIYVESKKQINMKQILSLNAGFISSLKMELQFWGKKLFLIFRHFWILKKE